jgi:hypothetical protein
MVALVKAGGIPETPSLAVHQPRSQEQLVDDLGAVIRLMQDLEDDLATCDETVARHGLKLQNLDIAMQMLRAVSAELTPGSSDERVSLARLADLRVACAKALGQ